MPAYTGCAKVAKAVVLAAGMILMAAGPAAADLINVAQGKPVSVVQGTPNGAALSTLTDGVFLPRGWPWQSGTVWWRPQYDGDVIMRVDLGSPCTLVAARVQADDNDSYTSYYHRISDDTWQPFADIPNYDGRIGGGMITRPDYPYTDTVEWFMLPLPIVTDAVAIRALAGDGMYSLSEIQVATPEPATLALLGLGVAGLLARRGKS